MILVDEPARMKDGGGDGGGSGGYSHSERGSISNMRAPHSAAYGPCPIKYNGKR